MFNKSSNRYLDEMDEIDQRPLCQRTGCRIVFLLTLAVLAIASSTTLAMIYYKEQQKEKIRIQKQKNWVTTWKKIGPMIEKFKGFEPISSLIISLVTFAIDEYAKSQSP